MGATGGAGEGGGGAGAAVDAVVVGVALAGGELEFEQPLLVRILAPKLAAATANHTDLTRIVISFGMCPNV